MIVLNSLAKRSTYRINYPAVYFSFADKRYVWKSYLGKEGKVRMLENFTKYFMN
jgi:hypothetical protein